MLILSRQTDESIMIGEHIVITVVDIRGDKVRLGIVAPNDVPVHRQEVYEAIQRENARAARRDPKQGRGLAKVRGRRVNPTPLEVELHRLIDGDSAEEQNP